MQRVITNGVETITVPRKARNLNQYDKIQNM